MLLQRCFTPNRVQVLSFPWVTDRFVTANMNAIKTQSYNPSYFLKGRFGEKVQCNHTQFLAGTQPLIEGPGDEVEFPSVLCSLTIPPGRPYWISRTFTTMISRLRLATKIGGAARLLQHGRISVPTTTRLMCQVPQAKEDEPEFGQFFRDISSMLKEKTGETGPSLLIGGFLAYALSKELLVLHDETVVAVVVLPTLYVLARKLSKPVTEFLDGRSQSILDMFNDARDAEIGELEKQIEEVKKVEYMLTARKDIVEVMRENNAMSLELNYRNKLHEVVREVKKRLDYQAEIEAFQRRTEQQHIVDWVEREVVKSISPQLEKESVNQCIKDLKAMAPA